CTGKEKRNEQNKTGKSLSHKRVLCKDEIKNGILENKVCRHLKLNPSYSGYLDFFYRLRRFFFLEDRQCKDAVLVLGLNAFPVRCFGQVERTPERMVAELFTRVAYVLIAALRCFFRRNREHVFVEADLEIFLAHSRYGDLYLECIFAFAD